MGWYRVVLHCALPPGFSLDGEAVGGFYTPRFVEASFDGAAGDLAIEQLQAEPKFADLRMQLSGEPVVTADDIEPAEAPSPDAPLAGFIFYPVHEEPEDAA
jgi:hypothetical protein